MGNPIIESIDIIQTGITVGMLLGVSAGIGGWMFYLGIKIFKTIGG